MQSRVLEGKEAGESVRGDVAAKAGGEGISKLRGIFIG